MIDFQLFARMQRYSVAEQKKYFTEVLPQSFSPESKLEALIDFGSSVYFQVDIQEQNSFEFENFY